MVTAAIPHPRSIKFAPSTAWKARHFITFQFRRWAKWRLRRNEFAYVDAIYRRWSPTWQLPPDETRHVKEAFAQEGAVEAALGYYWSFAATQNDKTVQRVAGKKTSVPTLCIVGEDDGALDMSAMPATVDAYTGPYRYEILPNAGHFLHRESPDAFAELVLSFLQTPLQE